VVLDRDVTALPAREISGARADLTLVSGIPVWQRP
jgi:hypothetical protein